MIDILSKYQPVKQGVTLKTVFQRFAKTAPIAVVCAIAGALLVPSSALADDVQPGRIIAFDSPECADLTFIGARGSGQDMSEGSIYGYGPEVSLAANALRDRLLSTLPSLTTKFIPVFYPAVPATLDNLKGDNPWPADSPEHEAYMAPYATSAYQGALNYSNQASKTITDCPTTRIVPIGYSQGAQVVSDGSRRLSANQWGHIPQMMLMAKPVLKHGSAKDPRVELYVSETSPDQFVPNLIGLINAAANVGYGERHEELPYPNGFPNVVEVCHSLDRVCSFDPNAPEGALYEYISSADSVYMYHGTVYRNESWMRNTADYMFFTLFMSLM